MDNQTLDHLASRQGSVANWLVWIEARNRDTGATEDGGFWDGADHQAFSIAGATRTYFGAGSLLSVDPVLAQSGLGVRVQRVSLALTPEAQQAIRGYDPSLAPVEIHRALFDPGSGALVAEPELVFAGTVDATPIEEGPIGGSSTITIEVVGRERALTRMTPVYKSAAALQSRPGASGDSFRRYAADVARWTVPWGQAAQSAQGPVVPPDIRNRRGGIVDI